MTDEMIYNLYSQYGSFMAPLGLSDRQLKMIQNYLRGISVPDLVQGMAQILSMLQKGVRGAESRPMEDLSQMVCETEDTAMEGYISDATEDVIPVAERTALKYNQTTLHSGCLSWFGLSLLWGEEYDD